MNTRLFVVGLLAIQIQSFATNRIILFKSSLEVQPITEEASQVELQKANEANVNALLGAIGGETRSSRPVVNLWLVQGAVANLTDAQLKEVEKLPVFDSAYDDQRIFLEPPSDELTVENSIEGLGLDPGSIWGLENIGVYAARKKFPKVTGEGVRVGILDTGIESNHYQFMKYKYVPGVGYTTTNNTVAFRDFVGRLPNPYDDHGHGTHVAGTIAGRNVGIARDTQLVVGKILHSNGYGMWSWILEGMQWMVDPDGDPKTADAPKLVSNSWGGGMGYKNGAADLASVRPLHRAVSQWRRFGIVPVFAMGNSGYWQSYYPHTTIPGGLAEVLAVGAYDSKDLIAYFSTKGPAVWKTSNDVVSVFKPELSAPGVKVGSAFIGGQYATWSGTSMATPHVAGALALFYQVRPKATFQETKQFLLASVRPKMDHSYGYGLLDALKLLEVAHSN